MYFNFICNKEGVKKCLNCIICNTKLIQHRFVKSVVFQLGQISHSEKYKVRLKRRLSLRYSKAALFFVVYTCLIDNYG